MVKPHASIPGRDGGLRQPQRLAIMQTGPCMWISGRDPAPQNSAKSAQAMRAYCNLTKPVCCWKLDNNKWSRADTRKGQHGRVPQYTLSTQNLTTAPRCSSLWCALSCRHDTQALLHSSKLQLKASSTCH